MSAFTRSAGRFPDGADHDSNCEDFLLPAATLLPLAAAAGDTNIKVNSVADLHAGQTIVVDAGANRETAVIASVGTSGGTTTTAAIEPGATVIPVMSPAGFVVGQTIAIDRGAARESAVVAATTGGGRGGPGRGGSPSITLTAPLKNAHAAEVQVAGSGLTLAAALTKSHESGAPIAGDVPTPGAPNRYARAP
jgi:hypothetical protein